MGSPVVVTEAGRIEGTSHDGYSRFLGIPYAAPPVGELRFRAPRPPLSIDGVLQAHTMPPHAPQTPSPLEQFMGEGAPMTVSEAGCLALNVWTPGNDTAARPVMVFIHGGAFVWGSSSSPMYDGARLAADHDVVVVTINYRLGLFGFTDCGIGGADYAGSGSLGVLDADAALRWAAANIAAFGGDPQNVTIFGESAGAMAVGTLLALPQAKGLFHKAILQSGAASSVSDAAQAAAQLQEICELLGTGLDVAALQSLPLEQLLDAQLELASRHEGDGLHFRPVVDGAVLDRPPLEAVASGTAVDVPLLVGTNLDEWRLFSAFDPAFSQLDDAAVTAAIAGMFPGDPGVAIATYRKRAGDDVPTTRLLESVATDATFRIPAIRLAEAQHAAGGDAWMYLLTWRSPAFEGLLGCCHGLELPLVFNTLDAVSSRLFMGDAPPRDLARAVSATWAAFARYGDPARGALGAWPRYDTQRRATMILDAESRVDDDPLSEERLLWEG